MKKLKSMFELGMADNSGADQDSVLSSRSCYEFHNCTAGQSNLTQTKTQLLPRKLTRPVNSWKPR